MHAHNAIASPTDCYVHAFICHLSISWWILNPDTGTIAAAKGDQNKLLQLLLHISGILWTQFKKWQNVQKPC